MTKLYDIQGYCDPRLEAVRDTFARNFESGLELGASFAVTINGEYVVDIWGGYSDAAHTKLWKKNTITCAYSTTKVMAALCALMLVDRGELDLDAHVADYWPAFAQNGKKTITVRQILSHSSGLSGFDETLTLETMYNWDNIIHILERQKPWWEPGTACGYHMVTFGYLVGELVRRISGKSIGTFFRDEVAVPLNADFHIGLAEEYDVRVADLVPPTPMALPLLDPASIMYMTMFNIPILPAYSSREWRAAEIPSTNGHGNARSAAKVGSLLACGGELDGVRLLSAKTIDRAIEKEKSGIDLVMGVPVSWGLGFGLASPLLRYLGDRAFYWGGYGGSWLEMDPDNRMCFSYVMNKLELDPAGDRRMMALRDALFTCVSRM